ncbi:hypothetical protein, partial [Escherichia coli]|uniref:hypothetical protein n=1 Tax=Escherichia coli TaxID=562 RepID=UPI00137AB6FB
TQSRIDFACFELGLPPLGLTAAAPYDAAWPDEGRDWTYPVAAMATAARERAWTPEDFQRIAAATRSLPATAKVAWDAEMAVAEGRLKAWAERFGSTELGNVQTAPAPKEVQNDDWIRDELILALDLY